MKAKQILLAALGGLARLSNPATDAAVLAVVARLAPGVHVDTTQALEVLAVAGLASGWLRQRLSRPPAAPAAPAAPVGK